MEIGKLTLIYFSAAGATEKIVKHIAEGIAIAPDKEYRLIGGQHKTVRFTNTELVVFGIPVYSGRVPAAIIDALDHFKGNSTPAIIACVYGNREYDDALLELKNIVETDNFKVIAAGTFVAEHSIFPAVAQGRPDEKDKNAAIAFGKKSREFVSAHDAFAPFPEVRVKGKFPYREISKIPLKPKGNSTCNKCGTCVKSCPVKAIDAAHPRKTDKTRCISCAHCISVCPQRARRFGGLLYKIAGKKFVKAFGAQRKEPETFFAGS